MILPEVKSKPVNRFEVCHFEYNTGSVSLSSLWITAPMMTAPPIAPLHHPICFRF
jgi:hypothetical protein